MHNGANSRDDYSFKSVDADLIWACKEYTGLNDREIDILLEISHHMQVVHDLEGGDIFLDCLTSSGNEAVVVAQYSPAATEYTRQIVGELMFPSNEPGVFRTLQIGAPSRKLKAVVMGEHLIRQNVSPIYNDFGKIIGVLIVERHIKGPELWEHAESGQNQQELLQAAYDAKEMEYVAEAMNDGMVRFNKLGIAVYINPSAKQLFRGINYMDEIVGMPFENLAFGNIAFEDIAKGGRNSHTEVKIGGYILNVVYSPLHDNNGDFNGAVMLIEDNTEIKNIEKELMMKSAVIDEIHHRVKNNLQTIISLLRLQSRRITSQEARTAFSEIISRIFSISVTHEILAQKGVDHVEIKEMLSRMLNSAKGYIIPEALDLSMEIHGDSMFIDSEIATAIAMVVNELVQNCIKHAFVGRAQGTVKLTIKKDKPYSTINVTDDGVGYNISAEKNGSLGHKLVRSLVEEKLRGRLRIESSTTGTNASFNFISDPKDAYDSAKHKAARQMEMGN